MYPKPEMPTLDLSKTAAWPEEWQRIAKAIIGRGGRIRASKPTLPRKVRKAAPDTVTGSRYVYADDAGRLAGQAAYVWRMVAFQVSPHAEHQCMPVTATFYLEDQGSYEADRAEEKRLDEIAKAIVDLIPPREWHGIQRWGRAFGVIGEPQYTTEGAVVYR